MDAQDDSSSPARRPEQGGHLGFALLEACARVDPEAVAAALARQAPLEARDDQGRTPLGIAAAHGSLDLARTLLAAGADPNASHGDRHAGGLGSPPARRVAAREGEEVRTPLSLAVESGELELVSLLIAKGARPYTGGATDPLELAILLGDVEIVRVLLDAGADPNARDSDGDTPLMLAAAAGDPDGVEALLEYGAIASARNEDGDSALDVAARAGRVEAFAALSPHFSWLARLSARGVLSRSQKGSRLARATRLQRMDRIHDDARFGRLAAVRKRLAAGVDPDARLSDDGETAMSLAVRAGHVSVVRALLEAGADANLRAEGETPLHHALGSQALEPRARPDVIRVLVQGGADPNQPDDDGLTPLMRAVIDGRGATRTVPLLVSLGADIDAEHPSGLSALELARADPAKAEVAHVLESLAEKQEERPAVVGLAEPARVRPEADRAVETLRGLGDPHASELVVAVRAPIDEVAPALEALRGGRQWSRKVLDEQGFFPGEEGYLVYQLRGHDWTLVQTDLLDARALHALDARSLSKRLTCDAALIEVCEASEVLRYALYREGQRVEEFGLVAGQASLFESTLREVDELERESAIDFVDRTLAAWDLFVPGFGDDRLEQIAREFGVSDFERVDFLRIDLPG